MATKKTKDTPAGYGRWDTIPGAVKVISKNTPEQQKAIDDYNASRAGKSAAKRKKGAAKK